MRFAGALPSRSERSALSVPLRRPNRVDVICLGVVTAATAAAVLVARASSWPSLVPLVLFGSLFAFA